MRESAIEQKIWDKKEIIVDCSVSGTWILSDEQSEKAAFLLKKAMNGEVLLIEPALWQYEMVNMLRNAVLCKRITEQMAQKSLSLLQEIPIEIIPMNNQGQHEILSAALQHGLSAYDATYLTLAERKGIELVTADQDLLKLTGRFVWIKDLDSF